MKIYDWAESAICGWENPFLSEMHQIVSSHLNCSLYIIRKYPIEQSVVIVQLRQANKQCTNWPKFVKIQPTCKSKDPNQLNMYSCYTYRFFKNCYYKKLTRHLIPCKQYIIL